MDKFENNEKMKKRPLPKSTWYGWINDYILSAIKRQWDGSREEVMNLFKAKNINEDRKKPKKIKKTS